MSIDAVRTSIETHLLPIVGKDVASLPIFIERDLRAAIAYTDIDGIFVREDVVMQDAHNAHVYIMHEIMHHVIRNDEITGEFNNRVVNYSEDYWINYNQNKLWGFDVRKVKFKGIYSRKYALMGTRLACEKISEEQELPKTNICGCWGIPHESILSCVDVLRTKYNLGLKGRQGPLILSDPIDERAFKQQVEDVRPIIDLRRMGLPVDTTNLTRSLFMSVYKPKPVPVDTMEALTLQEVITFCWRNSHIRETSVSDPYRSARAVVNYLRAVNNIDVLVSTLRYNTVDRIALINEHLNKEHNRKRPRIRKIKFLQSRLDRAEKRLEFYKQIKPFSEEFKRHPVYLRRQKFFKTTTMRARKPRDDSGVVGVTGNLVTYLIRLASRYANRLYQNGEDLEDIIKDLQKFSDPNEGKIEEPTEVEIPVSPMPEPTPVESDNKEETKDEEETEEDEEATGEAILDQLKIAMSKNQAAGAGKQGHRDKPKKSLSLLSLQTNINAKNLNKLTRIMQNMSEFATKLKARKSRKVDENKPTLDTMPTYSDNLDKMDASEIALLSDDSTMMLFYAKLASHGLLTMYPQDTKRQPVNICIDASGSMAGKRYEIAVGFTLALIQRLMEEKRGCSIVMFSTGIAYSLTITENSKMPLGQLLHALLAPLYAGTSFDSAIMESYRIKKEQNWKSVTTIIITDGDDRISPMVKRFLETTKDKDDRLVAMLVSGSDSGFYGLADTTIRVNNDNMTNELTNLGNSVL